MGYFKKGIAYLLITVNTLFAFSAQPKVVEKKDFALLVNISESEQKEIENAIKKILNIEKVRISKLSFKDDAHLYLTNKKEEPFSHQSPMQGVVDADKIFLLYFKGEKLFIALVDNHDKVLKNQQLLNCVAKRVHK
jgi:hypothetical protein